MKRCGLWFVCSLLGAFFVTPPFAVSKNLCECFVVVEGVQDRYGNPVGNQICRSEGQTKGVSQFVIELGSLSGDTVQVNLEEKITPLVKNLYDATNYGSRACFPIEESKYRQHINKYIIDVSNVDVSEESCGDQLHGLSVAVPVKSTSNVNYDGYYVANLSCKYVVREEDGSEAVIIQEVGGGYREFRFQDQLSKGVAGSFQMLIGKAIKFVVGMLGSVAFIMFVYGGILYMSSRGNTDTQKKALLTLAYAGIGVVIILSSYILVKFLFSAFS